MITYTRSERDVIISDAAELAEQGELYPQPPSGSGPEFNELITPLYLHISRLVNLDGSERGNLRIFLRIRGGSSVLLAQPDEDYVELTNKTGFGSVKIKLSSTEEECFQESLVNPNAIDYTTLLQIRKIVEYAIANFEEPE